MDGLISNGPFSISSYGIGELAILNILKQRMVLVVWIFCSGLFYLSQNGKPIKAFTWIDELGHGAHR